MIKIFKKTDANEQLQKLNKIEDNSWINLVNPTQEELNYVLKNVKVEEKILKEVLKEKNLPKIKKTKEATLIVIDVAYHYLNSNRGYNTYPLGIIICSDFHIITVSLREVSFLNKFMKDEVMGFFTSKKSRFCMQIFEEASNQFLDVIDKIKEYIEMKEQKLAKAMSSSQIVDLLNIEKSLVYFITSLKYNNTVIEKISKEYVIEIYEEDFEYLEDMIIDNKQCIEMCGIYREILSSIIETYGTVMSNNLNEAMRFLASITIVFSIPTMVASFLGMNVPLGFLATNDFAFLIIFALSIIIAIIIALWLKKRKLF